MKSMITDKEALSQVSLISVSSYLRSNGWSELEEEDSRAFFWEKDDEEILVPKNQTTKDYSIRVSQILKVLSDVEERSQNQIYNDIVRSTFDCVRLRINDSSIRNGNIPIEVGSRLYSKAYDLIASSAYSTNQSKPFFRGGRPKIVNEFLSKTKLGQSEEGSYIVSILTPIPPKPMDFQEGASKPFSRRVTTKLNDALVAINSSTLQFVTNGRMDVFKDSISHGVSANLCDAISTLIGDEGLEVETSFTWSSSWGNESGPTLIQIPADSFDILKEVSTYLKEVAPLDNFSLEGSVVKLQRIDDNSTGQITVHSEVEDRLRKISIDLDPNDYNVAIDAHSNGRIFKCNGELEKIGHTFILKNPRNVEAVDAE